MISKTLEDIEKDIKYLKKIANEEHFKKVEELCEEVNARSNKLQDRIDKAIEYIEENKNLKLFSDITGPNEYELDINPVELLDILKGDNK